MKIQKGIFYCITFLHFLNRDQGVPTYPKRIKVITACKHINIDYLQYVSPVYILDYMSSVYKVPLVGMCHHDYWPPYEGPQFCANLAMRRNKKG